MSSPVEQNVPSDFQEVLDLPAAQAGMDPKTLKDLQYQASILPSQIAASNALIQTANHRAQLIKKSLANPKLTPAARAKLTEQLRAQQQIVTAQKKVVESGSKRLPEVQNKVYEATGQYDKLLQGPNRDAFMALQSLFGQYGLGSLAGKIYDFVKQGYGADTISILLQDTPEYKKRFAGNEARVKAGLPVLNPADYLATESAYRQVLSSAGLPKGFYDNPADFTKWIADDVSPTEIKSRVDLAVAATSQANSAYKDALFKMYGINESDLTAYFLDRKRAEPILKKQAAAGAIGAAALRRGFGTNLLDMEGYATLGITGDQAEQAYAQIADGFESMLGIAGRYGSSWSQREAEQEVFTPGAASSVGSESASEKGKRLKSQERALFAGGRGSTIQGLNAGYSQT